MEKTKYLCTLMILSLLSTQVFAQKNVVWKWNALHGKKKADKILRKSAELKPRKESQALKYFKGAIIKKYKISEDDPYFNVGDGAEIDRSEKSNSDGGTHNNYIVSLKRVDTYDKQAFLDGEMDKAQSFTPPAEEIKTTRKFRCYQYTIGNSAEGKGDYKKESQCFLINSNGYVAGEDPDVHDYDNSVSEIKTNSIGLGCLKISRCEPGNIKVSQKTSGSYNMDEAEKKSWLGKLFNKNKSKQSVRKSKKFKIKDKEMSIQSCVGGCSEGYKMIKVKFALDGEEAPIREEVSKYCGELEESRYEPLGDSNSYAGFVKNALDGKGDRLLGRGFSEVYSTDSDPLRNVSRRFDDNRASQHFIYVNKCVSIQELEKKSGSNGNPESGELERPKYDGRKHSHKNSDPEHGKIHRNSHKSKPNKFVINGPVTINQNNGPNGTVLSSGGYNNHGWGNGLGGYRVIPTFANAYPQYTTAGVTPGVVIISLGGLQTAPQFMSAGQVFAPMISNQPGQLINPGSYTYNNNGQLVYNNTVNNQNSLQYQPGYHHDHKPHQNQPANPTDGEPEVIVDNGDTTQPYESLASCMKPVTVSNKTGVCRIEKKRELMDSGKTLKQVYEHLCREISDDEFEKINKSLHAQCLDKFRSKHLRSLAAREARERGMSQAERENYLRKTKVVVSGVEIQSSDFRSAGVRCVDSRKVSSEGEESKDEVFLDINKPYISLNPSEEEIQELGLRDGENDYAKHLKKYYNETLGMIDRAVDKALSPLDHQSITDENAEKMFKMSEVNMNFQGMYSPTHLNSTDVAAKRHKVNSQAFQDHAQKKIMEKLSKVSLSESTKKKVLDSILKVNRSDDAHNAAYTVGPVRFDKDIEVMKKRIAASNYDCQQDSSEELYKCSIKQGCNYFKGKSSVPEALSFCSEVNALDSEKSFKKWYKKHETLNASDEKNLHDVEFNFFGLNIDAKRDEGLVKEEESSREIEIGCDQVENNGQYSRDVVIHTIKYEEKGKKIHYVIDEECAQKNNIQHIFNLLDGNTAQ